jgi:hypothetical protein
VNFSRHYSPPLDSDYAEQRRSRTRTGTIVASDDKYFRGGGPILDRSRPRSHSAAPDDIGADRGRLERTPSQRSRSVPILFLFCFFVRELPVSPNAMDSDFLFCIQVDIIQCRLIFSLAFSMTGPKVHDESPSRAAGVYRHLKNGIIRLKFFTTPAFIIVLHHPLAGRWQMFPF